MNTPLTLEGHQVWDVVQHGATQLRVAPSGKIIGFDLNFFMTMAEALGYCTHSFAFLIPSAELGLLQSLRETQNGDS